MMKQIVLYGLVLMFSLFVLTGCSREDPSDLVDVKTRSGVGIEIEPAPWLNETETDSPKGHEEISDDIERVQEKGTTAEEKYQEYLDAREKGLGFERAITTTHLPEIKTTDRFNDVKIADDFITVYHAFKVPNSCYNVTYDIVSEEETVYIVPEYISIPMPEDFVSGFVPEDCEPDVYEPVIFDIEHDGPLDEIALFEYDRTNLTYFSIRLLA